ncbi:MAG TPA: hypothetical protein VMS09_13740 [Paenibacillus sp.]|uniref:hypothetical protein n=1 Tax=Paenibacillus sp. TaxID=58172 RepID=UPI0028D2DD62|nr:hypothetical protein [Paenibacillus sp.]HUC93063.1 hypothetical protein [Paenibacillus sp.]
MSTQERGNKRESDSETYEGPSKSGNGGNRSDRPGTSSYDKRLDGPNRPSV